MMLIRKKMLRKKFFLFTLSFFVLAFAIVTLSLGVDEAFAQTAPTPSGCPVPSGHIDFCRLCGPCSVGVGDCDSDLECLTGLTCVQQMGKDFCAEAGQTTPPPPTSSSASSTSSYANTTSTIRMSCPFRSC